MAGFFFALASRPRRAAAQPGEPEGEDCRGEICEADEAGQKRLETAIAFSSKEKAYAFEVAVFQ